MMKPYFFHFFYFFLFADDYYCGGLKGCVRCDKDDGTTIPSNTNNSTNLSSSFRCLKCTRLIVIKTRECVSTCPSGFTEEWSTVVDYMGRICKGETAVFMSFFFLLLRHDATRRDAMRWFCGIHFETRLVD